MAATADIAPRFVRARQPFAFGLFAAAAALGGAAIGLQYLGVAQRSFPSTLILLTGIAAAAVPLRVGLPVAVVFACFQTTIGDFFGAPGRYWKEAFVATLLVRALRRHRPTRLEIGAALGVAAVFAAYLATGTSPLAVGWAAKILLFSVLAGWAVYRLEPARSDWIAAYQGLAVAVGANVVLGIWQRSEGWSGLYRLGLPYGERIRQAPTGALRSFGGFTTAAPFSYTLALALLAWIGFLVADREGRRTALRTAWLPVAALGGIALSLDRIALVAMTAAVLLGALRHFRRRAALVLLGLAPLAVGGVLLLAGPSARSFLLEGFTFGSKSAEARRLLWRGYASELNVLGHGPASAGAAYERVTGDRAPPVHRAAGWYPLERDPAGHEFQWMPTRAGLLVGERGRPRRSARLWLVVASVAVPRTLTASLGTTVLGAARVSTTRSTIVRFTVPRGQGQVLVGLEARPPARRPGKRSPGERRRLAIRLDGLVAVDAGPPRDKAAAIYARVRRHASVQALQGTRPGVVDNLYLSWLFQYGVPLGAALGLLWALLLLRPTIAARDDDDSLVVTMRLWGLFLVVAALVVNIWEEFPVDFIVAIALALLYGSSRQPAASRR
jgi:hypothetical protein